MHYSAIIYIYLLITVMNLWANYSQLEDLAFYTKPLLMPLLALWFYFETRKYFSAFKILILGALFFSWGGDVSLMYVKTHGEQFFLMGLLSFLIAHILYITAFLKIVSLKNGFLQKRKWIVLLFLAFYISFNYFLIPEVDKDMQIPVLIYSGVIIMMVIAVLNWNTFVSGNIFQLIITGAIAFMLSDMIIALNKFKSPISNAGVWIMALYLFGQYRIVAGAKHYLTTRNQQ